MKFAHVFKELRLKKGYTQEQLAKLLNVSRSRIGMYENGNREPDFEMIEKIADFFNVSISYLMDEQPSESYGHITDSLKRLNDIAESLSDDKLNLLIQFANALAGNNVE